MSSKNKKNKSTSRLAKLPMVAASKSSSHAIDARVRWRSGAPSIAIGTTITVSTMSRSEIPSTPARQNRPNGAASTWVEASWYTAPLGW